MPRVYLGLGSNLGDGAATIRAAFAELSGLLGGARLSRLYRSRARYVEDQPDFINAAVLGETELSPRALLSAVNAIEAAFGRDRSREIIKGPRRLDIDILLYGSLILREKDLVIPHTGLKERQFALLPLLDLDAGLVDPLSGEPYSEIERGLSPQGIYLLE
jgi:2-amino-4-hydroxy-6-hydroxymethyldihydropteridine diphosphokinase